MTARGFISDPHLLLLAAKLDDLMAERAISQAKLARLMDTDPATVCRLLQGADAHVSTYVRAFAALDHELIVLRKSA